MLGARKLQRDLRKTKQRQKDDILFRKRMQFPGETVDAYSVSLRGLAGKYDFQGGEYDHRLLDQFILAIQDKGTQNRLLQEPPSTVDEAIAVARRYEAAKSINTGLSSSKPIMKGQGRDMSKLSSAAGSEKRTTQVLEGIIEGFRILYVLDTGASICLMGKGKWNKFASFQGTFPF